ncbi:MULTISPECIES: hypothetical protein [unclassified Campylobacter]|uniref:hypothetical protein n=1 Tax=unclassified Campylobacter TaxID=2593542 RepID=UPI001BDA1577|nr:MULTISPECIES: hypothetical protein [unclassified Campylobacter]MBZ7975670.1 hypothetical protein [Campylobacter sp. RM12637]MBZ7977323.1 hypothetical protein [Campylobacter sp. RM12654]MBZ7980516.1 hypothetical protein [Campylobacter sp. RM12642]MBZ7980929.1 hypothetical protein [Campylobacter sp. RM12640]MBZ7983973.1 hypothetical protein [Campylobacter sp. RM12647]MBZ7988248.1 hypothetical protein [Campylobacter sp. RM12635]MBZ7991412.1 hypothetical protein [Campylobacter sp. RM9331]MBZ
MPIPFILGAALGVAAVTIYNKKDSIKKSISEFNSQDFAKSAGKMTENAILKISKLKPCCKCEKEVAKKSSKK